MFAEEENWFVIPPQSMFKGKWGFTETRFIDRGALWSIKCILKHFNANFRWCQCLVTVGSHRNYQMDYAVQVLKLWFSLS